MDNECDCEQYTWELPPIKAPDERFNTAIEDIWVDFPTWYLSDKLKFLHILAISLDKR